MDARTRRIINATMIVIILAILGTITIGLLAHRQKGLRFTIVFEESKGLPVGAPVTLRGLRVGEVSAVTLASDKEHVDVLVQIEPAFVGEIPKPPGVSARIKKSPVLPGDYSVSLILQKKATGRMPDGARIEGEESWAGEKKFLAKGAIRRAYEGAVDTVAQKTNRLKDWWEGRKERKEAAATDKEVRQWLEQWENLDGSGTESEIRAMRIRARELAAKRRDQGDEEGAQHLEEIAQSIEEYEKTLSTESESGNGEEERGASSGVRSSGSGAAPPAAPSPSPTRRIPRSLHRK